MEGPGLRHVDNETSARVTRETRGGRTLTYKLNVTQQPAIARACGSGQKASTDRRPVDPPPIVDLTVLEGNPNNEAEQKDVTFSLNSNFFIFASLEHARVVAHGRVQQDKQSPPVLCGSCVAGIAYLDRPTPAGYFVFQDMSVRHEGKYRLAFSLMEEIKDAEDEDLTNEPRGPTPPVKCVINRLEVKSVPFTVYSAKKFPGLTESTELSRLVAEQGCRVRIRRDIRMRRRNNKPIKDWDGHEEATADARSRLSATPDTSAYHGHPYGSRVRSNSIVSHASMAAPLSRRPSLHDLAQAMPQTPQHSYSQSSPYGPGANSASSYNGPPYVQHQQPSQPLPHSYQSSHAQPASLPPVSATQPNYYQYGPPPAHPSSAPAGPPPPPLSFDSAMHSHRPSVDYTPQSATDSRRPSYPYAAPPPVAGYHSAPAYPVPYSSQQGYQPSQGSSSEAYSRPAPLHPPTRTTGATTPLPSRPFDLPPLNTAFSRAAPVSDAKPIQATSPASSQYYHQHYTAITPADANGKRSYSSVFNDRHMNQPLRHGARPSTPTTEGGSYYGNGNQAGLGGLYNQQNGGHQDEDHDMHDINVKMTYRRADGRQVNRNLPRQG